MSSEYTIGQYINPVPSEQLVATDNTTVTGNGSGARPLAAIGGSIAVVTDGITIAGDGTTDAPLETVPDKTPVLSDGLTVIGDGVSVPLSAPGTGSSVIVDQDTIVGAGTVLSPFRVDPAALDGQVAIDTDATLTGDGTASSHLSVVSAPAGSTAVDADGTSIGGNGTTGNDLHTIAGGTAVAVDGTTIAGNGLTATPLHVIDGLIAKPFNYTVTGSEPDLANLSIALPSAQPDTGYYVQPWQAAHANFLLMAIPDGSKTTTHFVLALSANATTGDIFNFTVMHP